MKKSKLSSKIRVVSNPKKVESYSEKGLHVYTKYASIVSKTLKKPIFQRFIDWLTKIERIENKAVKDIQIRVFPFRKENGKSVAGRCSKDGVILIFPKKWSFFQKKIEDHEKEKVNYYLKNRAMAALIHELLHVKYASNEDKVRRLTKKYFNIFIHHQKINNQMGSNNLKILFGV
jgi:hypothetical protein